jgi:hypothetical protein
MKPDTKLSLSCLLSYFELVLSSQEINKKQISLWKQDWQMKIRWQTARALVSVSKI